MTYEFILTESFLNSDSSSVLSNAIISGICIDIIWSKLDWVSWIKEDKMDEFIAVIYEEYPTDISMLIIVLLSEKEELICTDQQLR